MSTFVPVPGFPAYEISDEGVVRSLRYDPPRPIVQRSQKNGYLRVALYRGQGAEDHNVHVLVARAFLPPQQPGQEVRHVNSDPLDNRASNLAWGTRKENVADMMAKGEHYLQSDTVRRRCLECGMESNRGAMGGHRRKTGHTEYEDRKEA